MQFVGYNHVAHADAFIYIYTFDNGVQLLKDTNIIRMIPHLCLSCQWASLIVDENQFSKLRTTAKLAIIYEVYVLSAKYVYTP